MRSRLAGLEGNGDQMVKKGDGGPPSFFETLIILYNSEARRRAKPFGGGPGSPLEIFFLALPAES